MMYHENDLMLNDGDQALPMDDEYYSSRPGDEIYTKRRRMRRWGVTLVVLGVILISGGVTLAIGRRESSTEGFAQMQQKKDPTTPVGAPTRPPPPTLAPTHTNVFNFLASMVGEESLLETDSVSSMAYHWLMHNVHLEAYDNAQIKQRFALACFYFSTNEEKTWKEDKGWMSDIEECNWYGLECQNGYLVHLNMTSNGLKGLIPSEISMLSDTLLALELSSNDLFNEDEELAWMGELTNLRLLKVDDTYLAADGIPSYLGKLAEMRVLGLSETLFFGALDGSIFEPMQELLYLDLGGNEYNGTIPQEIVELPKLEALYLYDCGLNGTLDFIPTMTGLFEIWLDYNNFYGPIPTRIGALTGMASLSISECNLSGQIPTEIGKLTLLEQMWLFGNWLTGTIPTQIGQLSKLEILALEENNIDETEMPAVICDLEMTALSADCLPEGLDYVVCECCTCCEAPCPIVNLPLYNTRRLLHGLP